LIRVSALAAGTAAVLSFARRPDALHLWWSAVVLLGLAAVAGYFRDTPRMLQRGHSSEMLLWFLAVAGVVLTLISHR
jgi:hypothetical protein